MHDTFRRPRVLPTFFLAAVGGAFVALLYLGPLPFTLRGTAAILGAGATCGAFLAATVYFFRDLSGAGFYFVAAGAGVAGGGAWWVVVHPSSSILLAALVGAGVTLAAALLEGRVAQPR